MGALYLLRRHFLAMLRYKYEKGPESNRERIIIDAFGGEFAEPIHPPD